MARLAYERMRRIDEEDHERGLKEQRYNESVKYQRIVGYELNNPSETATVSGQILPSLQYPGAGKSSPKAVYDRVHLNTKRSSRGQGGDESSFGKPRLRLRLSKRKSSIAFVETEEEETRPFKDRLQ